MMSTNEIFRTKGLKKLLNTFFQGGFNCGRNRTDGLPFQIIRAFHGFLSLRGQSNKRNPEGDVKPEEELDHFHSKEQYVMNGIEGGDGRPAAVPGSSKALVHANALGQQVLSFA